MHKLSSKIFHGDKAADKDWVEFLKKSHTSDPGMTQRSFTHFKTDRGLNTYELLVDCIPDRVSDCVVLDLACGNGPLYPFVKKKLCPQSKYIGVDMVESEISLANSTYNDNQASFKVGMAQSLPIEDKSIDLILCHMAIMLMVPLEPVIAEIARVLKAQGQLICLSSVKKNNGGLFRAMGKKSSDYILSCFKGAPPFKTGDLRLNECTKTKEVFNLYGIDILEFNLKNFNVYDTADKLWEIFRGLYIIQMLPPDKKDDLKKIFIDDTNTKKDKSGKTLLEANLSMFQGVKIKH